jgi:hypothetical protein
VRADMEIRDPLQYPGWDDLVFASPGHSFFHTSHWARVLHESYDYRPCYLASIRDGKLKLLVPLMEVNSLLTGRRGVSLPFTDYCNPINGETNKWRDALDYLKDYGKRSKWKYLELRGGEELLGQEPFSFFYYRHILELSKDVDAIYSQFKESTKRNIKKALREGVSVTQSKTIEAVKTFYRIHCLNRKKHGVPPQPFIFFQKLYDHIISLDHGQVVLANYQGRTIAGAVYLHFGDESIYKFGASDNEYLHLRPNDILMWETIQWYCRNGYSRFCFGRTDPGNEGLRQFKRGWGAREEVLRYFRYDFKKNEFKTAKASGSGLSTMVFRQMPILLSKWVGKLFYRHVG